MTAGGPAAEPAVRTRGLTKRFRSGQVAVDHIDLVVPRGAVYGFLGPNGSGKTTTIRMLLGLVSPTAGSVELLGSAMPGGGPVVLPRVGALVEGPAFHPYLSARANLERLDAVDATASPRSRPGRIDAALERVGLTAAAAKKYRQYSLGMKQRLGLAAALLRPRDLLLLDEPTNGLDPQGTREVRALVRELADGGATVLVSSHLLSEIEQVCSHVGIMSRGELLAQGTRAEIAETGTTEVRVMTRPDQRAHVARVLTGLGLEDVRVDGEVVAAPLGGTAVEKVAQAVVGDGIDLLGLEVRRPTLEDVFVRLTGEGFDVDR
ncbi:MULTISPECIES: ABC transporter ATP-binding protein [unclassified Isoptericola]|uniref:ABC transporter ATP-binding protein n=1 Tax=unclassified Isoptericola TaxID=2623355 RepID=UPI002713DF21|nr:MULTISPECIES: ABC transporter ATP-binding protein [unclassified Isoptericola]MDO8146842.1 ABC transporter ATP-binding protein [Isoptericola sp. b515]MDO8150843.1 ABC transporter ATP-binding protein [Isoptericola sp. b408]